jgi:hypothetical protein
VAAVLESSLAGTGTLRELTADGTALVSVPGDETRAPMPARTCVPLRASDVGREVVVLCDPGRPDSLIVLGVIQPAENADTLQVTADGNSLRLIARESISLECGDAKITLHRSGKVVIRGAHVVSHSSGVNRIRGGSVQLN